MTNNFLSPNYSISQIINNYRTKKYNTDGDFIKANFSSYSNAVNKPTTKNNSHTLSINYLNQIIYDNGTGMLSTNIASLNNIQTMIINQVQTNIFLNQASFPVSTFLSSNTTSGIQIVGGFLNISKLTTVNISQFLPQYNSLLSSICVALKSGTYESSNFSNPLLSLCQNIAKYLVINNSY